MLLLCKLWPWLAGGLIGWLLSGWLARKLKYGEPPVEKIVEKKVEVEKVVDNPKHLSLISSLKEENTQIAGLKSQLADFQNRKPEIVEKVVVKEVDNPEHLKQIKLLEGKITELENRKPETVEKIVEKEVVKEVDNPAHLSRIKELEDEINAWKRDPALDIPAARAAGIAIKSEDDFTAIEGIGPKINDLIHADGIHTFKELSEVDPARLQKILDKAGPNFRMAIPGTWPDQANLAYNNRWPALKALQDILDGGVYPDASANKGDGDSGHAGDAARIKELESELAAFRRDEEQRMAAFKVSSVDPERAKEAGFSLKRQGDWDDFTVIEGIGPKINELIHNAGIHTYSALAATDVKAIQQILDEAGDNYKLARPETWPDQSDLAAKNRWEDLKKWQDELDGGKK